MSRDDDLWRLMPDKRVQPGPYQECRHCPTKGSGCGYRANCPEEKIQEYREKERDPE